MKEYLKHIAAIADSETIRQVIGRSGVLFLQGTQWIRLSEEGWRDARTGAIVPQPSLSRVTRVICCDSVGEVPVEVGVKSLEQQRKERALGSGGGKIQTLQGQAAVGGNQRTRVMNVIGDGNNRDLRSEHVGGSMPATKDSPNQPGFSELVDETGLAARVDNTGLVDGSGVQGSPSGLAGKVISSSDLAGGVQAPVGASIVNIAPKSEE